MNFLKKTLKYFKHSISNFSNTTSRASRKEFMIFYAISIIIGLSFPLALLFLLIPGFSLLIRRGKDLSLSSWSLLVFTIPIINYAYFLFLLLAKGDKGQNEYGYPTEYIWDKPVKRKKAMNHIEEQNKTSTLDNLQSKADILLKKEPYKEKEKEKEIEFNF